ncbi:MAG: SDR family oxidoreductase [Desulfovibrio sp.]|jgi:thioester reductase-like protein|nr:SDR family oxidoreductase [Desulfovibrio sp.]
MNGATGIFLTGATGFLGCYLLKEFMEHTEAPVYCLVRSRPDVAARQRVMDNARFIFGEDTVAAWPAQRLFVVEGDVGHDCFGLPPHEYAALCWKIGEIFHAAAILWHFGKKEEFENVNVVALKRLLCFAETGRRKALNHISTLAVSGRRCDNPDNLFTEHDFHTCIEYPNDYVESKHKAELLLKQPLDEGKNIRIFRPGFIMGDSSNGKFKQNITADAQYLHLRGHILMRAAPPLHPDDYMDITPVDYAASAIVNLAMRPDTGGHIYHICNPKPVLKGEVWNFIREYGYPIRVIPPESYLMDVLDSEDPLFLEGLQSVMVYLADYEKSPAVFDATRTLDRLEGTGIRCPEPDAALLKRYLDYCVDVEFIPTPEAMRGHGTKYGQES